MGASKFRRARQSRPHPAPARIQRGVIRRAIEIHHVARMDGHQHGCTHFACKCIQAFNMPIGVGNTPRRRRHARGQFIRQPLTVVRQADQQGRGATMQRKNVHRHSVRVPSTSKCARDQRPVLILGSSFNAMDSTDGPAGSVPHPPQLAQPLPLPQLPLLASAGCTHRPSACAMRPRCG